VEGVNRVMSDKLQIRSFSGLLRTKDGREFLVEIRVTPLDGSV
jgi:hypothetical protein